MDTTESREWGAYEGDGVEAQDCGEFRRALIAELAAVSTDTGCQIEVYADGVGLDCEDWLVATIDPRDWA